MTFIRDVSTMYASMFSLVLFMILFESRYPKKRTIALTLSLMVPLMLVNFTLLAFLGPEVMSTLLLITCSLPSLVFFWLLSKYRDGRFFFTFCFADTIMLAIIDLTAVVDYYLGNTYIFLAVSRLIMCPAVAFVAFKWLRPLYFELQSSVKKGWYTFAGIALLFYVLMSMAMSVPTHITQRLEQLPSFVLLLALVPLIYIHIFSTLIHQQNTHDLAERESILQVQMSSLCSRMEEYSTANELLRKERHDFRHKMRTIAVLSENGQHEELQTITQDYIDNTRDTPLERYCDHTILDAVLSSYLEWAKRKQIQVTTKLAFPDTLPVNENELATVLANAIENAIQACERIESSERYIQVKAITEPCFMIQIRNSFDGAVMFDADGVPITTRKGHGFGTRSIVTFCEKNNAFYIFEAENKEFTLRIIFH